MDTKSLTKGSTKSSAKSSTKSSVKITVMPEYKWPVGSHIPLHNTLYESIKIAINLNQSAVQFFLGGPYKFDRRELSDEDIESVRKLVDRYGIKVFSHAPYVHNLAGCKDCLAWSGRSEICKKTDAKLRIGIDSLKYELEILAKFNGGVVVHPGTFTDKNACLDAIVKTLNSIEYPKNSMLLLENSSGEGTKVPNTLSEFEWIFNGLKESISGHIFVCIDTCHIHAAGVYDFGKVEDVDEFFHKFDESIGIEKLKLIHLNDSKGKFGCKKDRHELLGQGHIWGESRKGLDRLIEYCIKYQIPTTMETGEIHVESIFSFDFPDTSE
jgi:deoxyribonuclease-4